MIKVILIIEHGGERVSIFETMKPFEDIADVGVIEYNRRFFVYEHSNSFSNVARFVETQLRTLMPSEGRVLV